MSVHADKSKTKKGQIITKVTKIWETKALLPIPTENVSDFCLTPEGAPFSHKTESDIQYLYYQVTLTSQTKTAKTSHDRWTLLKIDMSNTTMA